MNIFDIIGPVMIGPSSSHTAGAVRIGLVAGRILGERAEIADIGFSGSFAQTYRGHGTDKAVIAGILGISQDDERVRNSLLLALESRLEYHFHEIRLSHAHPNTALVHLIGESGAECTVQGSSIGGGNILITHINGMNTEFTGQNDTLIIPHNDNPGAITAVTSLVANTGINIGNFRLHRPKKGFTAVMTIEVDGNLTPEIIDEIRSLQDVISVLFLPKN